MENHSIVGGLGSMVAELMADNGIGLKLKRIGLQDTYAHGASQKYLMSEYGLDAKALVETVATLLGKDLGISETDLQEVRTVSVHSSAKAEAL